MTTALARARPAWWNLHARLDRLVGLRAMAAAFVFGALATLAHAPFFFAPAYALGLVALIWLLDGAARGPRPGAAAFARAWAWAFGHFLAGLYWIGSAFLQVEGGALLMIPAVLTLPAGLAVFWGLAARAALPFWTEGPKRIAAFAFFIALAELARGTIFTGFPWNLPGSIWPAGGAISQLASLVGVYGLSALTLLALSAPAALAGEDRAGLGRRVAPMLAAAMALGLAWGWGAQRLALAATEPAGPVVRVVDPGISQADRWRDGAAQAAFEKHLELTGARQESEAAIVVWPEGAIPGVPVLDYPEALDAIGRALGDRVLILGTVRSEPGPKGRVYFNSAAVVDGVAGQARVGQIYDKHHLVPFGEYLPFWSLYSDVPLAPLQQIGKGFTPGERPQRLIVPGAPPAVALICYEAIFTGLSPRGLDRADWIVNVSIDSWYGKGTGPWQHANMARFRAIEEGLPLVRAAAGGVSGVFDAYGRDVISTDLDGGAVEAPLPKTIPETIYARLGILLTAAILLFIAALRFAPSSAGRRWMS